MTASNRLLHRSAVQTGARVFSLVMAAVVFGLIARILTLDQFASYAAAIAIYSIATAVAEFGLQQTTVLALVDGHHEPGDVLRSARYASLATGGAAIAIALVIALALPVDAFASLVCMVPAFAMARLAIPCIARRQFELQLPRIAAAEVAGSATAGAILFLVFLVGAPEPTNVRFALVGAAMAASALVTFAVVLERFPGATVAFREHRRLATQLFRRSLPLGLTHALSYLHVRVDQILLAAFGLTLALTGYAVAYRFVDAGLGLVGGIAIVVFPLLSRARDPEERSILARDASGLLLVTGLFLGLITFYFAPIGVRLLVGPGFDDAVWILRLLTPAMVISVMSVAPSQVCIVERRANVLMVLSAIAVVVNAGLNALLIPHIGVTGSIIATTGTETASLIAMSVLVRSRLPAAVDLRSYLPVGVGFVAATFGALLVWRNVSPAAAVVAAAVGVAIALVPVAGPALDLIGRLRASPDETPEEMLEDLTAMAGDATDRAEDD